jgi:hypothetical protein
MEALLSNCSIVKLVQTNGTRQQIFAMIWQRTGAINKKVYKWYESFKRIYTFESLKTSSQFWWIYAINKLNLKIPEDKIYTNFFSLSKTCYRLCVFILRSTFINTAKSNIFISFFWFLMTRINWKLPHNLSAAEVKKGLQNKQICSPFASH